MSSGESDGSGLETSVLVNLGVSQEQAQQLIAAFKNKNSEGLPADLIRSSGLVEALKLNAE
jgi:hypothetical protein